ncbi:hypothetical protein [Phocaeicola dorei]|uniref:hypothetical protein n=1 Tax=Phocaeicola dorei TaxID=357276 RepID=UPI0022E7A509|nr:hypothetical protein [Phocaeicola dorei]
MILVKEAVKTLAIIVVESHIKEDAQLAHLNVKEAAQELVGAVADKLVRELVGEHV